MKERTERDGSGIERKKIGERNVMGKMKKMRVKSYLYSLPNPMRANTCCYRAPSLHHPCDLNPVATGASLLIKFRPSDQSDGPIQDCNPWPAPITHDPCEPTQHASWGPFHLLLASLTHTHTAYTPLCITFYFASGISNSLAFFFLSFL